jgi:hypothetical protein
VTEQILRRIEVSASGIRWAIDLPGGNRDKTMELAREWLYRAILDMSADALGDGVPAEVSVKVTFL